MATLGAQGGNNAIPVLAGLAVGVSLVLLFSIYGTSENKPSSSIVPPNSDEAISSEMPDDFSVIYSYGIHAKNILNTANNTFTHDMVADPSVVINLTLSDLELSTIWNSTQKHDFFRLKNLTEACPKGSPSFDSCQMIFPEEEYSLTITANGQTQTIKLRENYELNQAEDTDLLKFKEITATIDGILFQKEELKQLPKPMSGYA